MREKLASVVVLAAAAGINVLLWVAIYASAGWLVGAVASLAEPDYQQLAALHPHVR
jgi:hypothetical protein